MISVLTDTPCCSINNILDMKKLYGDIPSTVYVEVRLLHYYNFNIYSCHNTACHVEHPCKKTQQMSFFLIRLVSKPNRTSVKLARIKNTPLVPSLVCLELWLHWHWEKFFAASAWWKYGYRKAPGVFLFNHIGLGGKASVSSLSVSFTHNTGSISPNSLIRLQDCVW